MKFILGFDDGRSDITVSCNKAKWNNMTRFHSHPFYELYYVVEGERYFFVENRVYHISRGDTLLISPETEHRSLDVNGEGYTSLVINIPSSHIPDCVRPQKELCMIRGASGENSELDRAAAMLLGFFDGEVDDMSAYLSVLGMVNAALKGREAPQETEIESPTLDRMAEILKYLEEHYTEGINLASLSEKFYISEFYLCRLFKEYTGKTVLSYVTQLRIRRAKKLLSGTDEPISRIAKDSGFGSVSAFGKAFRVNVGMSPREYRDLSAEFQGVRGAQSSDSR